MTAKKSLSTLMAQAAGAATLALASAVTPAQALEMNETAQYSTMERKLQQEGHEIVLTSRRFGATNEWKGIYVSRKTDGTAAYILLVDHHLEPTKMKVQMKLEGNVKIFDPDDHGKVPPPEALIRSKNEAAIPGQCEERIRTGQFEKDNCGSHNELFTHYAKSYLKPVIQGDTVIQFPNAPAAERVRVTVATRMGFGVAYSNKGAADGGVFVTAGSGVTTRLQNMPLYGALLTDEGFGQIKRTIISKGPTPRVN